MRSAIFFFRYYVEKFRTLLTFLFCEREIVKVNFAQGFKCPSGIIIVIQDIDSRPWAPFNILLQSLNVSIVMAPWDDHSRLGTTVLESDDGLNISVVWQAWINQTRLNDPTRRGSDGDELPVTLRNKLFISLSFLPTSPGKKECLWIFSQRILNFNRKIYLLSTDCSKWYHCSIKP